MRDDNIRLAAFDWLSRQVDIRGDVLPWALLALGVEHKGQHIPLVSQQGIFRPRILELPISIRTSTKGPYDDGFGPDGLLQYRYRGEDPNHRDNIGLREAMRSDTPLAYFHGISSGRYLAIWPVYIVGDDPGALTFKVAVDDAQVALPASFDNQRADFVAEYDVTSRREYVTALVRRRVHQRSFREKVLRAYRQQCALCRLRHEELLDAAHIIPQSEEGPPVVRNGLALCKLHHSAYDAFFLAIRPNHLVVVREDILKESDGPMLIHGLQNLDGRKILVPRKPELRPDPDLLAQRFERFAASMHI